MLRTLQITIPAFPDGGALPGKYACLTANNVTTSPAIQWSGAPKETMSFALIVHDNGSPLDPLHWVIFNIPGTATGLPEGVPVKAMLNDGSVQLRNDEQSTGYSPRDVEHFDPRPSRLPHRYEFDFYALDSKLDPAMKNRESLERAMKGHILAKGTYSAFFNP